MHLAENIILAVVAAVTGLPETGTTVTRSKVYDAHTLPALSVDMGADSINEDLISVGFINRELEVVITAYVKGVEASDIQLNQIREEVYAAMMADHTLGLNYVIDVIPVGDDEPDISKESEKIVAQQGMRFVIKYRHSRLSAGV